MAIPYDFSGTSTLNVDRVLLPLGIEINALGGPTTKTAISESASGKESRFAYMTSPRREYTGAFGPEYVDALLQIWTSGLGPRFGFMIFDPTDYKFADVPMVQTVSSGFTRVQFRKSYQRIGFWSSGVVRTLYRDILLPDPALCEIKVNGTVNGTFTLRNDGIAESSSTFSSGALITCDCNRFYVPVRPADDRLDLTMHVQDLTSVQQIRFVEVLPGDAA